MIAAVSFLLSLYRHHINDHIFPVDPIGICHCLADRVTYLVHACLLYTSIRLCRIRHQKAAFLIELRIGKKGPFFIGRKRNQPLFSHTLRFFGTDIQELRAAALFGKRSGYPEAIDKQVAVRADRRPRVPVSYTHLDVYKRQL